MNFDGEEETQTKVHNALDRLSFATQVHNTADAFGQALTDAKEEVGEYASKATESLARFQAAQYAAKDAIGNERELKTNVREGTGEYG